LDLDRFASTQSADDFCETLDGRGKQKKIAAEARINRFKGIKLFVRYCCV
jgi:hypothetical protein